MNLGIFISFIALFVSVVSIYISWAAKAVSNSIAMDDFILKHRSFVQVKNFSFIRQIDGFMESVPETVIVVTINSPAKLISENYIIKNERHVIVDQHSYSDGKVLMNGVNSQYTVTFGDFKKELDSSTSNEYYREITLKYKALNSNKEYSYHSKSVYVDSKKSWDLREENMT